MLMGHLCGDSGPIRVAFIGVYAEALRFVAVCESRAVQNSLLARMEGGCAGVSPTDG